MKNSFLRWLTFLPLSILTALISGKIWDIINELSFLRIGINSTSKFYSIYSAITLGIIYGYVFVYSGTYIVPKHKKQTALFLTILINVICIYLFISYFKNNFFTILVSSLMYISIFFSAIMAYNNIKEIDDNYK